MEAANILKQVVGIIGKACTKNKVALVCTGDANTTAKGITPRPIGRIYLKHAAQRNSIFHTNQASIHEDSKIRSYVCTKSRGNDAARLRSDDIWAE